MLTLTTITIKFQQRLHFVLSELDMPQVVSHKHVILSSTTPSPPCSGRINSISSPVWSAHKEWPAFLHPCILQHRAGMDLLCGLHSSRSGVSLRDHHWQDGVHCPVPPEALWEYLRRPTVQSCPDTCSLQHTQLCWYYLYTLMCCHDMLLMIKQNKSHTTSWLE